MRSFLFSVLLLLSSIVCSQDWDVHVEGIISDALTGSAIPFAVVEVSDAIDPEYMARSVANVNGRYERELYTGLSIKGGLYTVVFIAEGYISGRAILDLTGVDKGKQSDIIWKINMDVRLYPGQALSPSGDQVIGACFWDNDSKGIMCRTLESDLPIVVEEQVDESMDEHAGLLNSLWNRPGVLLDGIVKDHWSEKVLEGGMVSVQANEGVDHFEEQVWTDKYGYYALVLPYDGDFIIQYSRDGMVSKRVRIVTSGIPDENKVARFRATVDIRLFQPISSAELDFLDEPLGVMRYDPNVRIMSWNMDVSAPLLNRLNSILEEHSPYRAKRK